MVKKNQNEATITSWEEADKCLKEIAESEIALSEIEAEMNIEINDIKERATKIGKPILENISKLTKELEQFTLENSEDMAGRSKQLNFGRLGFRKTTIVSVPKKKYETIIKNLKKFGMEDCIIIKETISKEVLGKYPDKDITKIGASLKTVDKFYLETDKEKIK